MDLGDIFAHEEPPPESCGNANDADLEEKERRMLELALERSVQDVGGLMSNANGGIRPSRSAGPPPRVQRHNRNTPNARQMNMSMDLLEVFEEEQSHGSDDEQNVREQPRYDASTSACRASSAGAPEHSYAHTSSHRASYHESSDRGSYEKERTLLNNTDDDNLLAQQEEEMIRMAMERSMQDFAPTPPVPYSSPRRATRMTGNERFNRSNDFGMSSPPRRPSRISDQERFHRSSNFGIAASGMPPSSPRRASYQSSNFGMPPASPSRTTDQERSSNFGSGMPPSSPRRASYQSSNFGH